MFFCAGDFKTRHDVDMRAKSVEGEVYGVARLYQAIAVTQRLESEVMSLPCFVRASIQEDIERNTRVLPGLNRMLILR